MEISRGTARTSNCLRACLVGIVCAAGMLLAGHYAAADAEEYSAYSDPNKTALSVILSEEGNAREFREEFGLADGEMQKVLSAVREENEKLAGEYAQSEEIVASNKSLSDAKISSKIAGSDYDETVEGAIEQTKEDVTALLPEGDEPDLEAWVDEQWGQEAASGADTGRVVETKSGSRALWCRVYATQYVGYTRYEASLPHRGLKFGSQPKVPIKRGARLIQPRIKEVGPWNTYDNYWRTGRQRTMWKKLPRCMPEAYAAYYRNYNRGRDEYGRQVLNPAGVDLTPAAAKALGFAKYQNGVVYVKFYWVPR